VASIESDGGRVLAKHSVVIVHRSPSNGDDGNCPLLCYDREATALLVPPHYLRCHDDPRTQRWYHPMPLTAHQAELFVRSCNQPGCFLVHKATAGVGYQLAVSLGNEEVAHYDIKVSPLGEYAVRGARRRFLSLSDLVEYYQRNAGCLATRLLRPLCDATRSPTAGLHFPAELELDRRRLHFSAGVVDAGGGAAVVWVGSFDGRPVAVKVLHQPPQDASRSQVDDEFLHETKALVGLRHCNVVQLVGVCTQSPPLLIVTEHGFSGTLKDHLRARSIPTQRTGSQRAHLLDIGLQVRRF